MTTATKAGRYEILGELGRGGMGVVYRARDPLIGRIVATKTIRLSEEGTGMSHEQLVEYFQTEARAAGLLTHPNIVVIYDVGESDGVYYITMELVNGKSLQSMLDAGEKFSLPRLLGIMEQVCSALQYAHDHGVVHLDIKPANIMLSRDDFVKITDFGTAKILQYGGSQQASALGTPGYMSPEQIKGKEVDARTDIFALGVMLYEMTTGQRPFAGQDTATILQRTLKEEPVLPHKLNPSLPLGVSSTILKALTKSPYRRYDNCRELLDDLKHYRPGETGSHANAEPATSGTAPRPVVREKADKNYNVEMPRIPGVEPRSISTPPAPSRARVVAPSRDPASNQFPADPERKDDGIYAGPAARRNLAGVKQFATIGAGVLLAAMLASFAIKTIGRQGPGSDAPAAAGNDSATPVQTADMEPGQALLHVTHAHPEVARVSELAQPWSSKRFLFRSLTASRDVPAVIIRLPGPASGSESYWAFAMEAPFSRCEFAYVADVRKLSSEYGYAAAHPMVVSPCSRAVFDPTQFYRLPGDALVRGAIVHGYDLRPPYSIEVKVRGNQIDALAME